MCILSHKSKKRMLNPAPVRDTVSPSYRETKRDTVDTLTVLVYVNVGDYMGLSYVYAPVSGPETLMESLQVSLNEHRRYMLRNVTFETLEYILRRYSASIEINLVVSHVTSHMSLGAPCYLASYPARKVYDVLARDTRLRSIEIDSSYDLALSVFKTSPSLRCLVVKLGNDYGARPCDVAGLLRGRSGVKELRVSGMCLKSMRLFVSLLTEDHLCGLEKLVCDFPRDGELCYAFLRGVVDKLDPATTREVHIVSRFDIEHLRGHLRGCISKLFRRLCGSLCVLRLSSVNPEFEDYNVSSIISCLLEEKVALEALVIQRSQWDSMDMTLAVLSKLKSLRSVEIKPARITDKGEREMSDWFRRYTWSNPRVKNVVLHMSKNDHNEIIDDQNMRACVLAVMGVCCLPAGPVRLILSFL